MERVPARSLAPSDPSAKPGGWLSPSGSMASPRSRRPVTAAVTALVYARPDGANGTWTVSSIRSTSPISINARTSPCTFLKSTPDSPGELADRLRAGALERSQQRPAFRLMRRNSTLGMTSPAVRPVRQAFAKLLQGMLDVRHLDRDGPLHLQADDEGCSPYDEERGASRPPSSCGVARASVFTVRRGPARRPRTGGMRRASRGR